MGPPARPAPARRRLGWLAVAGVALLLLPTAAAPAGARPAASVVPSVVANLTAAPTTGPIPLTVRFEGSGSGSFGPYTYAWAFGDGSPAASGPNVTHTYTWVGRFVVNLTVTDLYGATGGASITVTTLPPALVVTASALPGRLDEGNRTLISVNATGGSPPYSFAWTGLPSGCPSLDVDVLTCAPQAAGTFGVRVDVTDSAGATALAEVNLTVLGPAPSSPPGTTPPAATFAPVELVGVLAAAVAVGVAGGLLVRRRRRAPPTGNATDPGSC